MGLFSSIAGLFGAKKKKKAVAAASQRQVLAAEESLARSREIFSGTQANLQPTIDRGNAAGGAWAELLGLGGNQQGAIDALKASPLYQSIFNNGQEAVLQNASATGGLRGGNTQHSLFNLGTDTLAKVIQQQIANLFGGMELGAKTGLGLGEIGSREAMLEGQFREDQGQAEAGKILGKASADQDMLGNLVGGISSALQFIPGFSTSSFAKIF